MFEDNGGKTHEKRELGISWDLGIGSLKIVGGWPVFAHFIDVQLGSTLLVFAMSKATAKIQSYGTLWQTLYSWFNVTLSIKNGGSFHRKMYTFTRGVGTIKPLTNSVPRPTARLIRWYGWISCGKCYKKWYDVIEKYTKNGEWIFNHFPSLLKWKFSHLPQVVTERILVLYILSISFDSSIFQPTFQLMFATKQDGPHLQIS